MFEWDRQTDAFSYHFHDLDTVLFAPAHELLIPTRRQRRTSPLERTRRPSMAAKKSSAPQETWPDEIYDVLAREQVRQVVYVPDAGHARLIDRCAANSKMKTVVLTTEEEGIGVLAGAWLGGDRGVLLMQSSGVGNCINMLSLATVCRFPLLTIVTMRGEWGEFNPWQIPMGKGTPAILEEAGVLTFRIEEAAATAETVEAAARIAFNGDRAAAVLISQRVIGTKSFK
jgi:sulfopyruvate decarboxylase alpha subunit